jgi:hypothetical protein
VELKVICSRSAEMTSTRRFRVYRSATSGVAVKLGSTETVVSAVGYAAKAVVQSYIRNMLHLTAEDLSRP